MFRDSFRESNRNGHILYYDTEDILNALGSENVIKIIKKYAVSISEYVNNNINKGKKRKKYTILHKFVYNRAKLLYNINKNT